MAKVGLKASDSILSIRRRKYTSLALRLIVGSTFIYASIHKLMHPNAFAQAVYNYHIVPDSLVNGLAVILPWLEIICGFLLVIGLFSRGSILIINCLLILFSMAVAINLYRGSDIGCGCFGSETGGLTISHFLVNLLLLLVGIQILLYDQGVMALDSLKGRSQ